MRRSTMTASGSWATRWSARPKLRCSRSVTSARPDRSLFGPQSSWLRPSLDRHAQCPPRSIGFHGIDDEVCGISFTSREGPPSAARQ